MIFKCKLKAFSLVELMMLLLVSSLIIAALVPVVTKKHFRVPSMVIHGAYMCYYKDGQLWETKWSGKSQQRVVFDRPTENCVFVAPQKAAYFQISAIGGGGGGGDSGYTGGNPIGGWSTPKEVSPWGITEEKLADLNLVKSEFLANAGTLWGYARGGSSGSGGEIGYSVKNQTGTICTDPIYTETSECAHWATSSSSVEVTNCWLEKIEETTDESSAYDNKTIFGKIALKINKFFTEKFAAKFSGKLLGAASGTICSTTTKTPVETCEYEQVWNPRTCHKPVYCAEYNPDVCEDIEYTVDVPDGEEITYTQGFNNCCRGNCSCSTTSISGDQSDGCRTNGTCQIEHKTPKFKKETRTKTVCSSGGCKREAGGDEYDCGYYSNGALIGCTTSTDESTSGPGCDPGEGYKEVCETETTTAGSSYCDRYETVKVEDGCNVDPIPVYEWSSSTSSGRSGASGGTCASSAVSGNIGLQGSGSSNVYDGADGGSRDTSGCGSRYCGDTAWAEDGMAPCAGGPAQSCGTNVTFSTFDITGTSSASVRADSASAGGGGGGRTCTPNSEGECVDQARSPSLTSSAGGCPSGHDASADELCGSGDYGYCLEHANGGGIEDGGNYSWNYSYDNNYLSYGEPGSPGIFKTVIVRSLKNVDTTIKIGRGGSAAANGLGQPGAKGSPTTMGKIIFADGGDGGRGNIETPGEVLPTYNKETHLKEGLCYFRDKYLNEKNEDGTYKYPDKRSELLGKPAGYCDGMTYKFHVLQGRMFGELPTPVGIASSIMNFIFNTADNSDAIQKFVRHGRGGAGGGVEHRCWAGRYEVEFENAIMLQSSVFPDKASADAAGGTKYVPDGCRNDWSTVPAGPGGDGALLIKW